MGWTSCIEDILKRTEEGPLVDDTHNDAEKALLTCKAMIERDRRHVTSLLDLATDPAVDLAAKYRDLDEAYQDLLHIARELNRHYWAAKERLINERLTRKQYERDLQRISAKFESLTQTDLAYMRFVEQTMRA